MNALHHRRAQKLIQSGERLNAVERASLEAHLQSCADCRAYAAVHTRLAQELPQAFPPPTPSEPTRWVGPTLRVGATQQARLRAVQQALERSRRTQRWLSPLRLAGEAGMALFLVLAVVWAVRTVRPLPVSSLETAVPVITRVLPAPTQAWVTQESAPAVEKTPAAIPGGPGLQHVNSGLSIRMAGFAPDGAWLAYWMADSNATAQGYAPWPLAMLNFYAPASGEHCRHPEFITEDYAPGVWQPDGSFLIASSEYLVQGQPCGEFGPLDQETYDQILLTQRQNGGGYDPALSWDGQLRAVSQPADEAAAVLEMETTFTRESSGETVYTLAWQINNALGTLGLGGEWLTADKFLIYTTLDRGPLIMDFSAFESGGEPRIVNVAGELFGVEALVNPDPENYTGLAASAPLYPTQPEEPPTAFHLLLRGTGIEAAFPLLRLYHSESGLVETLPYAYTYGSGFGPTPEWLLLEDHTFPGGYENVQVYFRALEAAGDDFQLLDARQGDFGRFQVAWAPGFGRVALGYEDGQVLVKAFPENAVLNAWDSAPFSVAYPTWSPDGRWLATAGYQSGSQGAVMGLFVVDTH